MIYCLKRYSFLVVIFLLFSCTEKTAQYYIEKGIKHTEEQDYAKAESSFKKAIKVDPQNALAHYTLGGIYNYNDMLDDAIRQFKKAMELDPLYPDPHYSLGFVYEKMQMTDKAEAEFSRFKELKGR